VRDSLRNDLHIVGIGIAAPKVVELVGVALLEVRQDRDEGARHRETPDAPRFRIGKQLIGIVVVVERQADLLEVISALHAPRGFSSRLHGGKEQADQVRR
jgi:hypothetical protein